MNVTKTKFMLFTNRGVMPLMVALNGLNVECVDTIKFLGCTYYSYLQQDSRGIA